MIDWAPERYRIFETVSGSHMYGTSTPDSDIDTRGVIMPPMGVLLDPFHNFEQKDGFDGEDRVLYALAKFMKLAANSNPNVIEMLFAPQSCWVYADQNWLFLMEHQAKFLSKKVRYAFSGYAVAQAKSIKQHRSYLLNPPKEKPTREGYGLKPMATVSKTWVNVLDALNGPWNTINLDLMKDEYREEFIKERTYRSAKQSWDNYMAWKKNRNPKRMALEMMYGYDTKHAMHLLRLIYQGKELLLTGHMTFPLPQAEELLAVRNGALSYDELMEKVETMDQQFDEWYEQSPLPYSPDWKGLEEAYMALVL